MPLFAAADQNGRQGFVRIANRRAADALVRIEAYDETDFDYDPITLIAAGSAAHFNSDDLELGNDARGLSGGVGPGQGDWRLKLTSDASLDVPAYVRTREGFVTSMHDTVSPDLASHGRVTVIPPAGRSRTLSAQRLEDGGDDDMEGRFGDGEGKWRLTVASDQPIQVMGLLESPTGHLTNLSTAPGR